MKKILFFLFITGSFFLILTRCTKDKQEPPEEVPGTDTTDTTACDSTKVLYCNKIKPIIDLNCAISGCHVTGGTGNGIFSTYAGVKAKVDHCAGPRTFREIVLIDQSMPPAGPLTTGDLNLMTQWLDAGAPEK